MWGPELGLVLLVSPEPSVVGWVLLGLGLVAGFFVRRPTLYVQFPCVGAALFCICRDFSIPLDAVLVAGLPVCVVGWGRYLLTEVLLAAALVVNYFFSDSVPVPRDPFTPAVFAALYVGSGVSWKRWLRVGLVLARHLVPWAVHVLYGIPLYFVRPVEVPYYDAVGGATLLSVFFALLAQEAWSHYAFAGISVLMMVPDLYIRVLWGLVKR